MTMTYWTRSGGARLVLSAVISAAGIAAAAGAAAAEYHGVAADEDSITMVDKSSIYETGGYTRGWVVVLYADPTEDQDPILSSLTEFDCPQHRWRMITYTGRDEDGAVIDSIDNDDLSWENVQPSTIGEKIETAICSPSSMTDTPLSIENLADIRDAYLETLDDK
jgi:hypothetical protein